MPEAAGTVIPASPADVQRAVIARENGATYDGTTQTVSEPTAPAADATPDTPASGEPAQNAGDEANSEAPATTTPVEGGGDEDDSSVAAEGTAEPSSPQAPGKNHVARKIDKLTRENAELQRQLQAAAVARTQPAQPQQPQVPQQQADPQPDPTKYTDVSQFIADSSAWTARQESQRVVGRVFGALAQQAQQQQVAQQAAQQVQEFDARVATGAKDIKDFKQVTTASSEVEVAPHVAVSIMKGVDNPAMVLYHLAKNPGEVAKLNAMSPEKVAVRLGAIEANAQRPPAISNAPAPGRTVAAKGGVPSGYSDDMSTDDFMKMRAKK